MDCGYEQLPGFPEQEQIKGWRMAELKDVLNPLKSFHPKKAQAEHRDQGGGRLAGAAAPREQFVRRVHQEIHASGIERQATIESFDLGFAQVDAQVWR